MTAVILVSRNENLTRERDQLKQEKNDLQRSLGTVDEFLCHFCYIMKNWTESRRYCRERGASDHHQQQRGRTVWIGLSDSDEEGRWKWVDGSTLTSGFWTSGEPNSYMGLEEDCVVASYGWNDCPCNEAFRWICEKTIF
uniref:C-type lectin domain-containing protein n=1 Tax=Cyprinus carpio TaxID=7962 RepID=A0A8C1GZV7_CYPCA